MVNSIRSVHLIAALDFLQVAGKTLWNFCSFPGRGNRSSYGSPKVRYRLSEIQNEPNSIRSNHIQFNCFRSISKSKPSFYLVNDFLAKNMLKSRAPFWTALHSCIVRKPHRFENIFEVI